MKDTDLDKTEFPATELLAAEVSAHDARPSCDAETVSRPMKNSDRPESEGDTTLGRPVAAQGKRASSPGDQFHLAIFDDGLRSIELGEGTLLIGRSKRNQLTLQDTLLSRKHCSLTCRGETLTLVDLNSSNGTYVNGERIGSRELQIDDIVELGKTVLVVFDGASWTRGEGLVNLRNPVKAQELVQRLRDGGVPKSNGPSASSAIDGIRGQKGLSEMEKGFLKWLERGENRLLPGLVADYLTHKLVSLLVRNSTNVRAAFTTVLEDMMRPEFFQEFGEVSDLRESIRQLVAQELDELRAEDCPPDPEDRGLLESE